MSPRSPTHDTWKPRTISLQRHKIERIRRSLSDCKSFKGDLSRLPDLGERINDLLHATGLADDDNHRQYLRTADSLDLGRTANNEHRYLSEQFKKIAELAKSIQEICADSDLREYLSTTIQSRTTEKPDAATLVRVKSALKATSEEITGLQTITAKPIPSRALGNDPHPETLSAIKISIDRLLHKLDLRDLGPQLNARLRYELARNRHKGQSPRTSENSFTPQCFGFAAFVIYIDAVERAAWSLTVYEQSQIQEGHPPNILLDTMLLGLAPIFLTAIGSDKGDRDLPATATSDFICFCIDVLEHYFPTEVLAPEALGKRWQRLRKTA